MTSLLSKGDNFAGLSGVRLVSLVQHSCSFVLYGWARTKKKRGKKNQIFIFSCIGSLNFWYPFSKTYFSWLFMRNLPSDKNKKIKKDSWRLEITQDRKEDLYIIFKPNSVVLVILLDWKSLWFVYIHSPLRSKKQLVYKTFFRSISLIFIHFFPCIEHVVVSFVNKKATSQKVGINYTKQIE